MTDREFIQLYAEAPCIARAGKAADRMRAIEQNDRTGMIRRAFLFAVTEAQALQTAYATQALARALDAFAAARVAEAVAAECEACAREAEIEVLSNASAYDRELFDSVREAVARGIRARGKR